LFNLAKRYAKYITSSSYDELLLYFKFYYEYKRLNLNSGFQTYLLELLQKSLISINEYRLFDFIKFEENKEFIDLNIQNNWELFDFIMKNNSDFNEILWLSTYNRILIVSTEKGIANKLFCTYNFDEDLEMIIPNTPKLFWSQGSISIKIQNKFSNLLDKIFKVLNEDGDFEKFKKYSIFTNDYGSELYINMIKDTNDFI